MGFVMDAQMGKFKSNDDLYKIVKKIAFKVCKMNIYKKFFFLILASLIFSSCNSKDESSKKDKLSIVTTIYPIYDWVENIVKDKANVELLLNSGGDMHSWQPSAKDIMTIAGPETDLFFYVGGPSDFWVKKLITQMEKNGVKQFSIIENNEIHFKKYYSEEELCKDEHCHEHHHDEHSHEHHHDIFDEHIWLSLSAVPYFIESIANQIASIDEENKDFYLENAKNYIDQIQQIELRGKEIVNKAKRKTILVADRFPFKYFTKDLGIQHFAAFEGCSSESDVSFEVILNLSEKITSEELDKIVITETGTDELAKTIIQHLGKNNIEIKVLNAIQGKVLDSESYLSIMNKNLEVISEVLN